MIKKDIEISQRSYQVVVISIYLHPWLCEEDTKILIFIMILVYTELFT